MIEKLTRAQWAELSAEVSGRLREVVDRASLGPAGRKLVGPALDRLVLSSQRSTEDVVNLLVLIDCGGDAGATADGAEVLWSVPFTGNYTIYEPVRSGVAVAYRSLTLIGSPRAADMESHLSFGERGGEMGSPLHNDPMRVRLSGRLLRQPNRDDIARGLGGANRIANVCGEIRELATMWAFGGSAEWPRNRIDAEIEVNTGLLRQMGAIGP